LATVGRPPRGVQELAAGKIGVDILINNAGVIQIGPVEHMTLADFEEAMAEHFWGALRRSRRCRRCAASATGAS